MPWSWLVPCLPLALVAVATADDGAPMVSVPAATFQMGSSGKAIDEDRAEAPVHAVTVTAFQIDQFEVTCALYARFLNELKNTKNEAGRALIGQDAYLPLVLVNGQWQPKPGAERLPMVDVTWYGAMAYAKWAGKRLPTEAEWELAARGTDGRKFPWGNELDRSRFRLGCDVMEPVGSHANGASQCGALDMSGNAWEWTSSLFKPYPYVAGDGREDPQAPGRRVARGGSWDGEPWIAHSAYRFRPEPGFHQRYLGLRCAR